MVQKDIVWWNQSHLGAMIVTSPAFTSCQPMCCWRCGNNYISHPSGCNVPGGKWELVLGLCEKCSAQDGSYREYAFPLGNRVEGSKNPSSEPWQDPWRSLCWARIRRLTWPRLAIPGYAGATPLPVSNCQQITGIQNSADLGFLSCDCDRRILHTYTPPLHTSSEQWQMTVSSTKLETIWTRK